MILTYATHTLSVPGAGLLSIPDTPVPSSPFDVVSDDDFVGLNGTVLRWSGVSASGYYVQSNPSTSMLYRKLKVNSTVRVTAYQIYSNMSPANNKGKDGSSVPFYSGTNASLTLWPACVTIYDASLNSHLINSTPAGDTTTYVGESVCWQARAGEYDWFLKIYCDVTLGQGIYWWPVYVEQHGGGVWRTGVGYHSGTVGDFLSLRNYNVTDDPDYPPLYTQTQYMPYLHLFDADGNEYSV